MTKKLSIDDFILKANIVHNSKYDYSKSIYINAYTKLIISCPIHGEFKLVPNNHLFNKRGCQKCSKIYFSKNKTHNTKLFIEKANKVHNFKYDYSKSKYVKAATYIEIICLIHGSFNQYPSKHLSGNGCPTCKNEYLSDSKLSNINEFILKANIIHNLKYDYSKSIYISSNDYIEILCPKHNSFWQNANSHLSGSGCSKCHINLKENKWLDSIELPNDKNHRQVKFILNNKKIVADGYDPITNTIYEFYGDYWHGNPKKYSPDTINFCVKKTFGELYKQTISKEKLIIACGYKMVTIWEQDFDKL